MKNIYGTSLALVLAGCIAIIQVKAQNFVSTIAELVAVINTLGEVVVRTVINANTGSIDVSTLMPGIYVVKVGMKDRTTTIKAVIK